MLKIDEIKICPSCRQRTPPNEQVKRISRSSGRETISWRCIKCDSKRRKTK